MVSDEGAQASVQLLAVPDDVAGQRVDNFLLTRLKGAPRTLVCSYCVGLIRPPTPIAEATCDRCGRLANYLHTGAVAIGPILLNYGLCTPCLTAARHTPATATRKDSK